MNVKAAPFVPEAQRLEDAMYDALEQQFVKSNKWLFDDWIEFEYTLEKKFNQEVTPPPPTPVSASSPRKRKFDQIDNRKAAKPSYADIVKSK